MEAHKTQTLRLPEAETAHLASEDVGEACDEEEEDEEGEGARDVGIRQLSNKTRPEENFPNLVFS